MTLGAKLIELRTGKRLSQTEIAEKLGVSQSAYNKWESDASKPNIENFVKLCEFHEIDMYDLLMCLSDIVITKENQSISDISDSAHKGATIKEAQKQIAKLIENQNELIKKLLS